MPSTMPVRNTSPPPAGSSETRIAKLPEGGTAEEANVNVPGAIAVEAAESKGVGPPRGGEKKLPVNSGEPAEK